MCCPFHYETRTSVAGAGKTLRSVILALKRLVVFFTLIPSHAIAGESSSYLVFGNYMDDFIAYWQEKVHQQNSIVLGILLLGIVAVLIIRSGGRKIQ